MPIYREASEDASFVLPFMVGGEYVVPDASSVKYTVYDNYGAAIPDLTGVAVTTDDAQTEVSISVPASYNTLDGLETSTRTLVMTFSYNGHQYRPRISYILHSFLNFTVTPEDCRSLVGLDHDEFPDSDMDITAAYFEFSKSYPTMTPFFTSGGIQSQRANEALCAFTCLRSMSAIRRRQAKSQTTDGTTFSRADTDLDRLEASLQQRLSAAMLTATGQSSTAPTLLVVGTRTDELTGA